MEFTEFEGVEYNSEVDKGDEWLEESEENVVEWGNCSVVDDADMDVGYFVYNWASVLLCLRVPVMYLLQEKDRALQKDEK